MTKLLKTIAIGAVLGAIIVSTGGTGAGFLASFGGLATFGATGTVVFGTVISTVVAGAITGGVLGGLASIVGGALLPGAPSIDDLGANVRGSPTFNARAVGSYVFGETSVPLKIVFEQNHGADKELITNVFAHAWHEIESYEAIHVDGELVNFSGDAALGDFSGILTWKRSLGTAGQSALSLPGTVWTTTDKFAGMAHTALIWNFKDQDKLQGSVPANIVVRVKGAKLYDPRKDVAHGGVGSHDFGDPTTWEWEAGNAVLVAIRYMIGERDPSGNLIWGMGKLESQFDWASAIEQANVADELRDGKPRSRLSGEFPLVGDHAAFKAAWEANTGGKITPIGGKYRFWVPHDDLLSEAMITERELVEQAGVNLQVGHQDVRALYNSASGEFISQDELFESVSFAPIEEVTAISDDGGRRELRLSFAWIQEETVAQRVARYWVRRSRFSRVLIIGMGPEAILYTPFSILTLNIPATNNLPHLFRIMRMATSVTGLVMLTLVEENAAIYDDTLPLETPPNVSATGDQLGQFGLLDARAQIRAPLLFWNLNERPTDGSVDNHMIRVFGPNKDGNPDVAKQAKVLRADGTLFAFGGTTDDGESSLQSSLVSDLCAFVIIETDGSKPFTHGFGPDRHLALARKKDGVWQYLRRDVA